MAYEVVFKKRFINKLESTTSYLEQNWGYNVANNFIERLDKIINALKYHPEIGAVSKKLNSARGIHITKHNRLFYKIDGNKIIILDMYDTRKREY